MDILDIVDIPLKRKGYILPPGIFEISGPNLIFENLLLKGVKVSVTNDDIRLIQNLKTNQTFEINKKIFS